MPGDALSVVAITKLPFDVPSDPIIAARGETFENPFNQYMVPEAILRFRQGFGRLIRTQYDRGVVVIYDRRVLTKTYGRAFLESLPQCTVQVGPARDLPDAATRWLKSLISCLLHNYPGNIVLPRDADLRRQPGIHPRNLVR